MTRRSRDCPHFGISAIKLAGSEVLLRAKTLAMLGILLLILPQLSTELRAEEGPPPSSSNPSAALPPPNAPLSESRGSGETVQQLQMRIDILETKLTELTEKLERLQGGPKSKPSHVTAHPAQGAGTPVLSKTHSGDPEVGFVQDDAVQTYRKAMILYQSQKYPDAVLAFSGFLEKYPDHPWAGAAQFRIGDSYFKQNEYKLAMQELQRVLTSYDRSSHVPETLREMAEAEDKLQRPADAARYRLLLTSLFPHSPAAARLPTKKTQAESPEPASRKPQVPGASTNSGSGSENSASSPKLDEPPTPPTAPLEGTSPEAKNSAKASPSHEVHSAHEEPEKTE